MRRTMLVISWLIVVPASPGSTVGACSKEESLKFVAESINRAHKETEFVIPVIENMVRLGT
jgi:AP endonuclease-1